MVLITEIAKQKLQSIKKLEQDKYFRIEVLSGGCSGFSYNFSMDDRETEDVLIEDMVIIDNNSILFLENAKLDFINNLSGQFFNIDIPEATSKCGCGTSFDFNLSQ